MNLSMKWLSDFVEIESPVRKFAADMTMSGSKVEGYAVEGEGITGVVVGKVLSVEKHPNADTLYICRVDAGGEQPLQIVTAADNVVPGAMVPVATDGAVLSGGKKIRAGKLRGEASEGMLCSLGELGLTGGDFPYASEDGIFLLEEPCAPGQDALEAIGLNDTVVEFEITSNRPDCLSVIGLAREAAVTYRLPFDTPQARVKGGGGDIRDYLTVRVDNPELCLRYAAAAVRNVRIAPSPRWMRERLRAAGVRPINNIVDITNYVMLEYGQPMHAFDLVHVKGASIIVRNAAVGETITTLDGIERTLSPEMLVIADESSPSAVAGVMGGEWSGIYDTTQTVIFESACFQGRSVRLTSKKLGLRTESSSRFEKGLDPENCIPALKRACELVELLEAGEVVDGVLDVASPPQPSVSIPLNPAWVNEFLGINLPGDDMERILRALGCRVENGDVIPPSFRADLKCKADIAEEIARFYGYDKIPATAIRGAAQGRLTDEQQFSRSMTEALRAQGLSEVVTYSFISPKAYDAIRLPAESPLRRSVVIRNPLGEDTGVMRSTALPSMLDVLARNWRARNERAWLYEIATEYVPKAEGELPDEPRRIVMGMYGSDTDFYTVKGVVEALLERAGVTDWRVVPRTDDPTFHPGRCATLILGEEEAGVLGQVHPLVRENYRVDAPIYLARVSLDTLHAHAAKERVYKPLPRFPGSTRDLALVCDEALPAARMEEAIRQAVGKLLADCKPFDVYRSQQIGAGKKSVAWSLTLRAGDRTLTDEECDRAVGKALKALEAIGATIRG